MVKKIGTILMGLFVVVFSGVNLYSYFNKDNPSSPISGMFVKELPYGLNMSLVAFVAQWVILLLIVTFAYMKFLKHRREEESKAVHFIIPKPKSKAETNLDVLYDLLKDKKSLSTETISKVFNISKEKSLEWAKILEDHDLATIEYPAFSDPEIRIKEKESEDREPPKFSNKKPENEKNKPNQTKQNIKEQKEPQKNQEENVPK